jgi:hypothetical protein
MKRIKRGQTTQHKRYQAIRSAAYKYAKQEARKAGVPYWNLPQCPGCNQIPTTWENVGYWISRHTGELEAIYTFCPDCAKLTANPTTKYGVFQNCEEALKIWYEARKDNQKNMQKRKSRRRKK